MGVLEELGITEEELNQAAARPPLVEWDSIPKEEPKEADDFFRQLREGKFDTPAHPTHPDESGTGSIIDEIIGGEQEKAPAQLVTQEIPVKKKSKSKRVAYSVSCTLKLSGSDYQVQLLPASSDYDKAYRLNKLNAQKPTGYNVTQIDGEILCECHDFRFRQDGADTKGCKHIRGLVDMGMFAAPPTSHRTGIGIFDG